MSDHPIVHGAQAIQPTVHNRLEIRDLAKDRYQFSLYIQALNATMEEPFTSSDFAFPSIGGIHGRPFVRWGDSGGPQPEAKWGGYCTHGSVLFPTWHRPYVLLFEQAVFDKAQNIARQYRTDQEMWAKAAEGLRSPYWDWASAPRGVEAHVPEVMITPTVKIITPNGEKTVANPLYSYKFIDKQVTDTFPEPWVNWSKTLRYPTSKAPNAESNMKDFDDWYEAHADSLRESTLLCILFNAQWETFSNHTAKQVSPKMNSLETIHDGVHDGIGGTENGGGHMSDLGVAGFDVAFYLHHTNVDRLLSLWTAIHPDEWVTPGEEKDGTYTLDAGSKVDGTSDLTPFWNAQSTYWKSVEVRDTRPLWYSYPEFNGLENSGPEVIKKAITAKVAELYGGALLDALPARGAPIRTWNLHLRFKKYEFGASFSVDVLLDGVLIGSVSSFATTDPLGCANCAANLDKEIEGFVHLTDTFLTKYPELPSHELEHVRPLLENITFRLRGTKADGSAPDIHEDLPSLKILPFSLLITQADDRSEIPRTGHAEYHPGVLQGGFGHLPYERWALPA